ncbi:MAG: HEAT repeat domain-containing protein [Phototrophicaceae bacterium]
MTLNFDWRTFLSDQPNPATHPNMEQLLQALLEDATLLEQVLWAVVDPMNGHALRTQVGWVLGTLGTPQIVQQLVQWLQHPDAKTVSYAAYALSILKNPNALEVLIEATRSHDDLTRQLATGSIGNLKSTQAMHVLAELTQDPHLWVRSSAVWALGEIANPSCIPALAHALHDEDQHVTILAIASLSEIGTPEAAETLVDFILNEGDTLIQRESAGALVQMGAVAGLATTRLLRSERVSLRELGATVMSWIYDPSLLPSLIDALSDSSAYVREQAARALGRMKDTQAIAALQERLTDESEAVRRASESSLKKLGYRGYV